MVGREAVAEGVRGDLLGEAGQAGGTSAELPHGAGRQGAGRMGGGEEPGRGTHGAPVAAEVPQQRRRERDVAVLTTFGLPDVEHHPGAVHVPDLKRQRFGDAEAGGVERHQDRAMLEVADDTEEGRDLLPAEHDGELLGLLGEGDVLDQVRLAQADAVEEAQGADGLIELGPGGLLGPEEVELEGADVLGAEPVGGSAEVASEAGYAVDVDMDGAGGVVPDREVLDHTLAQGAHGGLRG